MGFLDAWDERLRRQRIVALDADIDSDLANRLTARMLLLHAEDPVADIRMCVNSHGGSVPAGLAIFDTMRLVACDVATCASGTAAGMAQFLLSAGAPGKRSVLPGSRVRLRRVRPGADTPDDDPVIVRTRWEIAELIAEHTGQPVERVLADQEAGLWFSAAQAVAYGLADRVVEPGRGPWP